MGHAPMACPRLNAYILEALGVADVNVYGSFLCVGETREPCVIWLNDARKAWFDDALSIASKHGNTESRRIAYRDVLGEGITFAMPCWLHGAMAAVMNAYSGPHADRMKQIAACIIAGVPYGPRDDDGGGWRGGNARVPVGPDIPGHPGGAAVQLPAGAAT